MKTIPILGALEYLIAGCSGSQYTGDSNPQIADLFVSSDSAYFPADSSLIVSLQDEFESYSTRQQKEPVLEEHSPEVLVRVLPTYPHDLVQKTDGEVTGKLLIDKTGRPRLAKVLNSSHLSFIRPSLVAAMQFQFSPATINHTEVPVWVSFPMKFRAQ